MNSLRVISLLLATLVSNAASTMAQDRLNQHPVQLDTEGKASFMGLTPRRTLMTGSFAVPGIS